jgi:alkylhydroperoxidase family enzyme
VLAESPQALAAYHAMSDQFQQSSLLKPAQLVVRLDCQPAQRLWLLRRGYSALAKGEGVDDSIVEAIREDKPIDDAALEAVRVFTAIVVEQRGWVADHDVQAFLDNGFTQRQILDVFTGVAQKTLSNYANHLAGTPLDKAFTPFAA